MIQDIINNYNEFKSSDINRKFYLFIRKITKGKMDFVDMLTLTITAIIISGAIFSISFLKHELTELHLLRIGSNWGQFLFLVSLFLIGFRVVFLAYQFILYLIYKPLKSVSDELLPTCTVIVPAYNEGKLVLETFLSIIASDYPREKLQIIGIDDGSKDDTWEWMKKAKSELGDSLVIYQQPENKGKRHALYRGFNCSTSEIFVTIDSDSIVKADTLRNLVTPFVLNENCGAVAGNVRVLNKKAGIIPRMLNVSFTYSFEFVRAAQSVIGSVLCTPGALAAYRKDAVMACLPEWINQRFMGQLTDIGEDRAMTNMILKQGLEVKFQQNALVLTETPVNYKGLYKMFIRWERSNVRENIMLTKFAFSNFRIGKKSGIRLLLINQWLKIIMAYPMLLGMLAFLFSYPVLFISTTIASILVFSSVSALFYAKVHHASLSFWAYTYSIFYTFSLFWITPYAILTATKRGWLTRG
jgi:hyaluronan synthase